MASEQDHLDQARHNTLLAENLTQEMRFREPRSLFAAWCHCGLLTMDEQPRILIVDDDPGWLPPVWAGVSEKPYRAVLLNRKERSGNQKPGQVAPV
jgi:hypothetical protein